MCRRFEPPFYRQSPICPIPPFICFFATFFSVSTFSYVAPNDSWEKQKKTHHGKVFLVSQRQCYLSFEFKAEINYLLGTEHHCYKSIHYKQITKPNPFYWQTPILCSPPSFLPYAPMQDFFMHLLENWIYLYDFEAFWM